MELNNPSGNTKSNELSSSKKKSKSLNTKKREKITKEDNRKSYKVMIRKLPFASFTENNFKECLQNVLTILNIKKEDVDFLHFMEGKLR